MPIPSLIPRTPKYRHYKPKDLAVVRIDGRDIYLGRYGSPESHEKYHRLIAEWSLTGVAPLAAPPLTPAEPVEAPLTAAELILRFWKYGETYYRRADGTPTGELANFRQVFRRLKTLYGSLPAKDFGPKELKLVRQHLIDAGLSRRFTNRQIQRVKHLVAFGVENGLLPPSAHHALLAVKAIGKGRSQARETEPIRPAPDEHVEAAKRFLSRQLAAVVDLQCLTGARSSEILVMRTCDIDTSGAVWEFVPSRAKCDHLGKERRIFFGPRAQATLRDWLRSDPKEYLFQPKEARKEWEAGKRARRKTKLTPSQRARKPKDQPQRAPGDFYTAQAYGQAVKRACVQAGVPHWHPHQLRHSAATRLRKEFGVEVAQVILGHSSPIMTERYAEKDRAKAVAIMSEIG